MTAHSLASRQALRPPPTALALCLAAALSICPLPSAGAQPDGVSLAATFAASYDDNLFRLPDGLLPNLPGVGASRGDLVSVASFAIDLRKSWRLQQVEAGYEHVEHRYRHHGFLDHTLGNYRLAWRWHVTPRIGGTLSHRHNEALVDFGDFRDVGTRNVRSVAQSRLDADWRIAGGWRARGVIDRLESRNSRPFSAEESHRVDSGMVGLRYVFRSNNWLEATTQQGRGRYLGRTPDPVHALDTDFVDRRDEVRGTWERGKTRLEASLGHLERTHDTFAQRDYRGGIGSLRWRWTPTGKLSLDAVWRSDLVAFVDQGASYYRLDSLAVTPSWQLAPKLRLGMSLERRDRVFRGGIVPLPGVAREDRSLGMRWHAEWRPLRQVGVMAHVAFDRRDAHSFANEYDSSRAGLSVQVAF